MADRVEEYLTKNGVWLRSRENAILVTPDDVRASVQKTRTAIDLQYFVGTAKHESNFAINERDTESDGFETWGIYQVSSPEAMRAGLAKVSDALKLDECTRVMVYLAENLRFQIRKFLKLPDSAPDPVGIEAYIAIGHNQGLGQAKTTGKGLLGTLFRYGLDWPRYVANNPHLNIVAHGYGNDVLPLHSPLRKAVKK